MIVLADIAANCSVPTIKEFVINLDNKTYGHKLLFVATHIHSSSQMRKVNMFDKLTGVMIR